MEDLNPITLFAIMQESLGVWLWPLILLGAAVLIAAVTGALKLRRTTQSARNPIFAAVIAGAAVTALSFALVPGWSQSGMAAFNGAVDYLIAFALALIPGILSAGLIFSIASRRCARRSAKS